MPASLFVALVRERPVGTRSREHSRLHNKLPGQARPSQAKRRPSCCAPVVHKDCAVLAKNAVDVEQVADVGCVEAQAL